jgi:DNA-binding HxlR family transcriptional regulator
MFLIAPVAQELASWDGTDGKQSVRANSKDYFAERLGRSKSSMNSMRGPKAASSIFIGKWTPRILFSLRIRPHRPGQLRRELGSVSQRMLTRTLRNLESANLVARHVTRSKAITVEYSLTKLGRTIIAPLRGMCHWAQHYSRAVSAEVHFPQTQEPIAESKGQ